jgi:hypothetical protein
MKTNWLIVEMWKSEKFEKINSQDICFVGLKKNKCSLVSIEH